MLTQLAAYAATLHFEKLSSADWRNELYGSLAALPVCIRIKIPVSSRRHLGSQLTEQLAAELNEGIRWGDHARCWFMLPDGSDVLWSGDFINAHMICESVQFDHLILKPRLHCGRQPWLLKCWYLAKPIITSDEFWNNPQGQRVKRTTCQWQTEDTMETGQTKQIIVEPPKPYVHMARRLFAQLRLLAVQLFAR